MEPLLLGPCACSIYWRIFTARRGPAHWPCAFAQVCVARCRGNDGNLFLLFGVCVGRSFRICVSYHVCVHPCRLSANSSVPKGPPSAQGSARAPPLPTSALYAKFGLQSKTVYLLGYQRSQRRNLARWLRKRGVVISAYLPKVRWTSGKDWWARQSRQSRDSYRV